MFHSDKRYQQPALIGRVNELPPMQVTVQRAKTLGRRSKLCYSYVFFGSSYSALAQTPHNAKTWQD